MDDGLRTHLKHQQFVSLATATRDGRPHASPKLLLKYDDKTLHLIDYLVAHTSENIHKNPYVCVTTFNIDEVFGYHIFGKAEIIPEGETYKKLMAEWEQKQIRLAADQVVETVKGSKHIKSFKFTFLKPVMIYKINISCIEKIDSKGLFND